METTDTTLRIGDENRAFILEKPEEVVREAYKHPYLGGTVTFDVDIRDVGCGCRAGVYLTTLNDNDCTWDQYTDKVPSCSTLDLMEAHTWGFSTRS